MARQQVKQGGDGANRKEEGPQSRARQAATEGPAQDPRVDRISQARARADKSPKGKPTAGGKGRDARALREQAGANAKRGNEPPPKDEEETEEEDEELEEAEDDFWKGLVAEAYRSRKRRGEWEGE